MRTALIYHAGDPISGVGLARWLASFSDLVAVVEIDEPWRRSLKRIRREWKRSGLFRMIDVLAFRLYYLLWLARADRKWQAEGLAELRSTYAAPVPPPPLIRTSSPNNLEAEAFLRQHAPDVVLARSKSLLKRRVFSIPADGTFVLHPGICPDYRNAHGCFWALSEGDLSNVGMTLLRIDEGIDTGPVFGHYFWRYERQNASHIRIQNQVLIDNLDAVRKKLLEIHQRRATPIEIRGRPSREWGQPWLSAYLRWRNSAAGALRKT